MVSRRMTSAAAAPTMNLSTIHGAIP
jgi:hypothetical protein